MAAGFATVLIGIEMKLPATRGIDARLLGGSALFGIGWGLAGFCPGPALVALGMGLPKALTFVAAMLVGMLVFELLQRRQAPGDAPPEPRSIADD